MTGFRRNFQDAAFVAHYTQQGPPAFMPGHAGVLQMTGVLPRDRYAAYARASGVDAEIVDRARAQLRSNPGLVPPERDASLVVESGFHDCEAFYVGMAWRGWLASA